VNDQWLEKLQTLAAKYNQLGIDADIASLSLIELWELYLHLSRLGEG
jgi:hypothetical protein